MDKNRSTSRLTNVITVNTVTDDITVPASITVGANPATNDSTQKVATTNWVNLQGFVKTLAVASGGDIVVATSTGAPSASLALVLSASGVTAGTYNDSATAVRPFTVDAKGRITSIGNAVTVTPAWASITSKPTTVSGFGITDFYSQVISGFVVGANSTVLNTDTLEVAIEKLQGQINARQATLNGTGYVKMSGTTITYVTSIGNSDLTNSTISGVSLGSNLNALTLSNAGTGAASGSTYNGSAAVTISYNSIGAQPLATNLTSLAGLTFASTSFVKMTAAGTFALDTNTYLTATTGVPTISFGTTGLTPSSATSGAITVAGTLVVGNGGTGATTLTGVVIGNGTSAMTGVAGTAGQLLRRNAGNTAYEFFTPTYISSYTETSTLADVTGRGATTSTAVTFNGGVSASTITTTGNVTVGGDLTVNGSITTINSTTISVDDKNIELGSVASPTNTTADGGGITLKGATDKTFNWVNATGAWTSSEDINLLTGKVYEINGTTVLSATALGSGVTGSSLTSVGTITSGTWNGTAIAVANGGTGATTAANARTNLGLAIGSNVQAWDADLDAIAALAGTTGLLRKTAANTWSLDTTAYTTNTGTVTSVALSSGNGLSVSGSPVTTSGTLTIGAFTDNFRIGSLGVGMAASGTSGRIDASGDIVGFSTSDIRLKKDITILDNASELLSKLRGVSYVWDEQSKDVHGYSGKDYGVIAQDVEKVFPEMIQHRDNGYMAVRYERLIGVLVAALNEQTKRIAALEDKLK